MIDKLAVIRKECVEIYTKLMRLSVNDVLYNSSEEIKANFDRLRILGKIKFEKSASAEIFSHPKFSETSKHLAELLFYDGIRVEREDAESVIHAPCPWEQILKLGILKQYLNLVRKEYYAAGLKPGAKVVFLGSGPLPSTIILLCYEFGVKCIGIDRDPEIVRVSRELIGSLGLGGDIRITVGDHFSDIVEEECDHLIIASDAKPKSEIFAHLAETLPHGKTLSYRMITPMQDELTDLSNLIMQEQHSFQIPDTFREYHRIPAVYPIVNTVVFLRLDKRRGALNL